MHSINLLYTFVYGDLFLKKCSIIICLLLLTPCKIVIFKLMWVFVIDKYSENNEFVSGSNNFDKTKLYIDTLTSDSMIYENYYGVTMYDNDN